MTDNKLRCVLVDEQAGIIYHIPRGINYISRGKSDSIVPVGDDKICVSRCHLEIFYGGAKTPPMLIDCSSNGTYINGEKISAVGPTPTRIGDIISLGSSDYKNKEALHLRVQWCIEIEI